MLKTLFPLSFTKRTIVGVILYLSIYVGGALAKGIILTFTDFHRFGGYLAFFVSVYTFVGLFILSLKHLGYIKNQ